MDQKMSQIELVNRARSGDRQCLGQLAQQARQRLSTYVYRLTQQEDLAQEIVQESLLEMCKVIGKLKKPDRFWPWLYSIATNKLRRHYRTERTQRKLAASSATRKATFKERQDGLEDLVSDELKQIVSTAMKKLKTRHKAVLIMRCYDQMPYSEIAESMGCSEFSTRMLFLRAKKSLQRELSRNGFRKGTLLAALLLFGKLTAPSKAAAAQVSITTATTNVGLLAGIIGLATTKTAVLSLATAGALTAGTMAVKSGPWKRNAEGPPSSFTSTQDINWFNNNSNEEEYWYYFPQGPTKSMMLRAKSGIIGDKSSWQILQNNIANYYYRNNTVYINNYRMWASDLSVLKIPTDDPQLTDFLYQVESKDWNKNHIKATGKGLLVIAARNKTEDNNRPWAIRHYNVLDEDYFQGDWPTSAKILDKRDEMHRRGWTYFKVTGQINGQYVSGTGRIPFVYDKSEQHSPWMKLQVGSITIVDISNAAYLGRSSSDRPGTYPGGCFFKGLARPWMGFHTIDTIRRDAAEKRIWFETKQTTDSKFAQVELICEGLKLIYKIDLETDVIDEITFSTDQGNTGNLKFSYLQSIEGISEEFRFPGRPRRRGTSNKDMGLLWLVRLADGSLG